MLSSDDTRTTVGKTFFYQGEGHTHPLFCIAPGIPCQSAREQASELIGVCTRFDHRRPDGQQAATALGFTLSECAGQGADG